MNTLVFKAYSKSIPLDLLDGRSQILAARDLALEAIEMGLPPIAIPRSNLNKGTVKLSESQQEIFLKGKTFAESQGFRDLENGRLLGAFCNAYLTQLQKNEKAQQEQKREAEGAAEKPTGLEKRPEQDLFYARLKNGMTKGMIVMAEGATGIGKGLAMARAVKELCEDGLGPALVAAPSLVTLQQDLAEWFTLDKYHPSKLQAAIVLGKGNFIDPEAVLAMSLEDESLPYEDRENIVDWLNKGALAVDGSDTETIRLAFPQAAYLYADLVALAPESLLWDGVTLDPNCQSEDNPAYQAYLAMRNSAREADVTFCTHAMLAAEQRHRRLLDGKQKENPEGEEGPLPLSFLGDYNLLVIDEAHDLERAIAMAETSSFSIMAFRARIKQMQYGSQQARNQIVKQCSKLMDMSAELGFKKRTFFPKDWHRNSPEDWCVPSTAKEFVDELSHLRKLVSGLKSKKSNGRPAFLDEAVTSLYWVTSKKRPMQIDVSPVRCWPSVSAGPWSVADQLRQLWNSVYAVGLVSATLYLPDHYGGRTHSYMQQILNIPASRLDTPDSVTPTWVTDPVTLHRIDPKDTDLIGKLTPPSEFKFKPNDKDKYLAKLSDWIDTVAGQVAAIADNAKGGSLVLLTAYDWVSNLEERLAPVLGDRLVVQRPGVKLEVFQQAYTKAAQEGRRPVWLAVGAAWTGLDLNDKDCPDLLTDEVIPRLPFGLNHTLTASARHSKGKRDAPMGMHPQTNDAAFTLKQGIGRLVRHKGAPHKSLWILDPRIWLTRKPEGESYYQVFQDMLKVYSKTEKLKPVPPLTVSRT